MDAPTPRNPNIADPASFHPALAASAWIARKEARGQAVDLDRIANSHHLIERPTLIERIHARSAEIGINGQAPLNA